MRESDRARPFGQIEYDPADHGNGDAFEPRTGDVVEPPDDPALPVVGADLHRALLVRTDLRSRRFERCAFRNALFGLALLDRAQFVDRLMPMAEFDGASLADVRFAGGLLNATLRL